MNSSLRNNVLAGAFLLITVVLAVALTFILSDRGMPGASTPLVIRFDLATGAHGLKEGSPVLLGGQRVGQVTKIDYHKDVAASQGHSVARTQYIDVLALIKDDLEIGPAAVAELDRPLVGSISTINISSLGRGEGTGIRTALASALDPDAVVIRGTLTPPAFMKQAGFGPDQAQQIRNTVKDLEETSKIVRRAFAENGPRLDQIIASSQAMVAQIEEKLPEWTSQADTIVANASATAAEFPLMAAKLRKQVDDIDAFLARNTVKTESIIAKADATMTNVDEAAAKVNRETITALNATLKEAQEALSKLQAPLVQVRDFLNEDLPQVKTTLANARLMSEQLKITANEVRAQPWRLLVRPNTRELSAQLVFDSARSYAGAVSDLKAASDALAAAQAGGRSDRIEPLARDLEAAISRAREAEELFLEKMREK